VAVEVAVEMAVEFQSGSRKKSGSRKTPHPLLLPKCSAADKKGITQGKKLINHPLVVQIVAIRYMFQVELPT